MSGREPTSVPGKLAVAAPLATPHPSASFKGICCVSAQASPPTIESPAPIPVALPHMVLDATANNGLFGTSTLPISFDRAQVLSLEGDFDRYFTLYCPRDYERDALYVFTPDLLALLIDESRHFDVEIVDDWMFVYSATRFDMTDPGTLRRLFRIVDTVGAKTLRQTARYADGRASGA